MDEWSIVYERAIRDDGSLFFPERLTRDFLERAKRSQGSYIFANQYLNQIIPEGEQSFKKEWFKYWATRPERVNTFAFIDPAISLEAGADFTACVVVSVDSENVWYVDHAQRYKITPTEIVNLVFRVQSQFKPKVIGIEDVAYQKALLYMVQEESKRRGVIIPVKGVRPDTTESKESRILGLVPRMEWSRLFLKQGMNDLEMELMQFPRATHDDLCDALSQIETIAYIPEKEKPSNGIPNPANVTEYESWYRKNIKGITDGSINPNPFSSGDY